MLKDALLTVLILFSIIIPVIPAVVYCLVKGVISEVREHISR